MKKLLAYLLFASGCMAQPIPTQTVLNQIGTNTYVGSQTGSVLTIGPGTGTLTSLTAGAGITLTPSTITTTGVIALTTTYAPAASPIFTGIITLPSGATIYANGGTTVISGPINLSGLLQSSAGIKGVVSGADAAAGNIGEYVLAEISDSPGTSISNATEANIFGVATAAITLTAGDWDIGFSVYYNTSGATITQFTGTLSPTTASSSPTDGTFALPMTIITGTNRIKITGPTRRVNITGSTPYYLNCSATFSAGTIAAGGKVWARRSANAQ